MAAVLLVSIDVVEVTGHDDVRVVVRQTKVTTHFVMTDRRDDRRQGAQQVDDTVDLTIRSIGAEPQIDDMYQHPLDCCTERR